MLALHFSIKFAISDMAMPFGRDGFRLFQGVVRSSISGKGLLFKYDVESGDEVPRTVIGSVTRITRIKTDWIILFVIQESR